MARLLNIQAHAKKPSLNQRLSGGIAAGLEKGMSLYQKHQDTQAENSFYDKLTGGEGGLNGVSNPELRQKILEAGLQGKSQRNLQELKGQQDIAAAEKKQANYQNFFGNLQEGGVEGNQNQQNPSQPLGEDSTPFKDASDRKYTGVEDLTLQEKKIYNIDPIKLGQLATTDSPAANALISQRNAIVNKVNENLKRHEKKISEAQSLKERKEAELRAETLPIRKAIAEKANIARESIANKENLIDLIDKGDLNDPTFAALASALPLNLGKRMLSDDTVQYKAGLIDEFGDLKNIFKGATRVKEVEIFEDKLADLYLTDSQKKAILRSRLNANKADIIRAEVAAEMEAEGNFYGALQFENELNKRAKPLIDALANKVFDEHAAAIKDAENRKQLPLDANDPEDTQIIDQILKEAKGDWKKAEKIAQKKGYKF